MGSVKMAQEALAKHIEEMKNGEVEPAEFYKNLMSVLSSLEVTNNDLKGVTPQLLAFVNGLLRNMSK
jgi:archaellum component FlaF (FlaF/FlaG flagellin family)